MSKNAFFLSWGPNFIHMTESLTHSDGFSFPFLSMCIPFIQTSRWERWVGKKKNKNPWKLFPGLLPRNEWWIDPRNSFKSHFLCSCEVMRFLCATLWALEWMKMAQNTLKVYHWFKVIDGWSCLIVLYCWTIHHSKQTLYSIVQYMVTCGWRVEGLFIYFSQRAVGGGMRERRTCHFLLQNYKVVVC